MPPRPRVPFINPDFLKKRIIKNYFRFCKDVSVLVPYYESEIKHHQEEIERIKSNMELIDDLVCKEIENK